MVGRGVDFLLYCVLNLLFRFLGFLFVGRLILLFLSQIVKLLLITLLLDSKNL